MATLLGIAIKRAKRAPMELVQTISLTPQRGLEGDYRGAPGKRQVTLLSLADWHSACGELNIELPWLTRRANLLVDTLPLFQSKGQRITLGSAVLEITGETDPCERMESAHPGLFSALAPQWRGGVTCRVLQEGELTVGMDVSLTSLNK